MTELKLRTQEEILARITETRGDDWAGFRFEVLAMGLTFDNAKAFLKDGTDPEEWQPFLTVETMTAEAKSYFEFACGKITDHRGISAQRSVEKLTEHAWLLGREDVVTAMEAADYSQYGAPKVKAFGVGMGFWGDAQDADQDLVRMAQGDPCRADCDEGCGR